MLNQATPRNWMLISSCVALSNCSRTEAGTHAPVNSSTSVSDDTSTTTLVTTSATDVSVATSTSPGASTADESTADESNDSGVTTAAPTTETSSELDTDESTEHDAGTITDDASSADLTSGPDTREVDCSTVVVNAKLGKIATVGVVTFSADFHIDSASVEFAPAGQDEYIVAPVDLNEKDYKTFLLGMKQAKEYVFRVVIDADGKTCTSPEQTITTGVLAEDVFIERVSESVGTPGFFVSTTFTGDTYGDSTYIFDTDGDLVWEYPGLNAGSRARLDWEGKNMWSVVSQGAPEGVRRVSLDGEEAEEVASLARGHHDLTVLPGGRVAVIAHGDPDAEESTCARVLEYDYKIKTTRTVVANVETLFQPDGIVRPQVSNGHDRRYDRATSCYTRHLGGRFVERVWVFSRRAAAVGFDSGRRRTSPVRPRGGGSGGERVG